MTDQIQQQAADPRTPGETLARIAYERPDLRATIAANPAAYPELLTWLGAFGDPQVNAAIAARTSAPVAGAAAALVAVQRGARIVRTHDVGATRDVLRLWAALDETPARSMRQNDEFM